MPDSSGITWTSQLKSSSSDPMTTRSSTDSLRHPKTSSASLKSLSDKCSVESLRRALSKSSHGENRGRSTKMSKRVNADHPVYPDQSFASLAYIRPRSPLRTRSSHTTQVRRSPIQGAVTADNTPKTSPGLFTFPTVPRLPTLESLEPLPQLHHLQTPKETYTAEIEHDTFSGNKFINNYEIVQELGRGEHGKVKLARNVETSHLVAVKIVPRYSRMRRLGRLGAPEDRTKREVAILKKARHPNVVSLLEVIDDPNKNKVYLILEYIEKGEIKWRKSGVREVVTVMHHKLDLERAGFRVTTDVSEKDLFAVAMAYRRHEALEKNRQNTSTAPNWSLEHGFEEDSDLSRTASIIPSRTNSHDDIAEQELAGSMYGAYEPETYRARAFSMAASTVSHMSSEINFDEDHSSVPAMTLEEARRAFRDTLLGLEFLHFIGIIHRDIKPANLLVTTNGAVKISDFGVSYLGRSTGDENTDGKPGKEEVTEKDARPLYDEKDLAKSVGTPAFWAPEVCYDDPSIFEGGVAPKIGTALDLWALGITLYCMVYAQIPFSNHTSGLNEQICKTDPFLPRVRLVPVDTSMEKPSSTIPRAMNSNKRTDYELKFEVVPEEVRDLIRRLLTKDPAHRITITEAKKHPWVVEGMADPSSWIRGPDLEKEGKGRILEIDEKEMSHAVVKRTIIEKALNTASRIAGSLLGRRESRKRASSTATSRDSSESISPASTARDEHDRRRKSLRGDELLTALKASRETEHPLAQSVTASPDVEKQSYFDDIKSASTGQMLDERPKPDRAISTLSAAESIKTIRPSHSDPIVEPGLKSRVEGLWEGTTRAFTRLASRDRRGDRSPSSSRNSFESEGRAGPSLAVSTAPVSGAIQQPDELQSPPLPSPPPIRRHHSAILVPTSTDSAFEHAQDINQRRLIQEVQHHHENTAHPQSQEPFDCPPSPDDIIFIHKQRLAEVPMQTNPSASTIASDFGSVSQSMSNPSFGMRSSASSPPGETFLSAEYKDLQEPTFMRTADTITQSSTGKPLEDAIEAYDDDDDSEEEVMVMGGPKRK